MKHDMDCAPFELFAIRYGKHRGRSVHENYLSSPDLHDAASDLDYYVWLARRSDEIYLIDTGFDEIAAHARGRELLCPIGEGISLLGVSAKDIKNVILTHLHYDHAGTIKDFPNAKFHIQEAEVNYATGRYMLHKHLRGPFELDNVLDVIRTVYDERVVFYRGDATLTSGLSVHLIGGHTAGLQVVRVWTKRGWVVIASDATHLYGNIDCGLPFPILFNVGELLAGYDKVRGLADSSNHIIPGHDPLVMNRYPAYSRKALGKIVCLDREPS